MALSVRYIKMGEMCRLVGKTPPTIRKMIKTGEFPKPRKVGGTFLGWLESDFQEWVAGQKDEQLRLVNKK
ncbi:AlpA family phage regulatory protein [Enterobacter asburiae]|uniref:helix-turn-helix transcriptional regulator n=1 Tax=Enterobacter TaxID=547 RepID=UPI001C626BC1|nr:MULTISPECIES: AlpA family phage regulatory protein [Enterobacter]MCK6667829.1 AlpA family phage regulatory protein [Enterobacter asburiae]QYH15943.1 AlpA family phage regulatory protein [Enterobacter sp. DNB-S2]